MCFSRFLICIGGPGGRTMPTDKLLTDKLPTFLFHNTFSLASQESYTFQACFSFYLWHRDSVLLDMHTGFYNHHWKKERSVLHRRRSQCFNNCKQALVARRIPTFVLTTRSIKLRDLYTKFTKESIAPQFGLLLMFFLKLPSEVLKIRSFGRFSLCYSGRFSHTSHS